MNKNKIWCIMFFVLSFVSLAFIGAVTVIIDPFFHYHKPLASLQYPIENQRYQNDGIVKHFDYDAIITGTSMTQNFKTSEFDKIFEVNSIKVAFSSGSFKEINQNLERAIKHNDNIKYIIRSVEQNFLDNDKDTMYYDLSTYPNYLYNSFLLDDVSYIFNNEVLFKNSLRVLEFTKSGKKTTSFDYYNNWNKKYKFGKEEVDKIYVRKEKVKTKGALTNNEKNIIKNNVEQNLLKIAIDNPDIKFYYFYPPYSIYHWDNLHNDGSLRKTIETEKYATELLLQADNIYLFSFWDNINMIENLDNYKDQKHYGEWINSNILEWFKEKTGLLTYENYDDYYKRIDKIYSEYDYDSLFE